MCFQRLAVTQGGFYTRETIFLFRFLGELIGAEHSVIPAIHSRKFSTKDAALAVHISTGKLQNWLTHGVLQLEGAQHPGRGQSRTFSAYEIARIALMKKLAECGVPLETAFKITSAMKHAWEQLLGGHEVYGGPAEPGLHSWLVVVLTRDWPPERKGSVQFDAHTALWVVDEIGKPDSENGLTATLLALGATPAIVVNMGRVLNDTLTELEGMSNA